MLTQSGYEISCFASIFAFAFTLYNALRPDPCAKIIDSYEVEPEYDFVIIGGGTGGSVVANRLSEVEKWTVLLLEAGGHETDYSDVPYLLYSLQNTRFDWKYKTEPPSDRQRYCLAMTNHSCKWPKGKVLGGSSVINGMQYVRGNRRDYDNWEAACNKGWGFEDVLPYFLKSENNTNTTYLQTPYHSCGGYQSVEDLRYSTPLADAFVNGGKYLGYDPVDVNGAHQTGFTNQQEMTRDGRRCSESNAFIRPAQHRPNVNISLHSFVTRIGFENEQGTPRAKTVYFVKHNKKYSVKAKKEIILSAGSISSPQILMLSGIGPEQHLTDLGIKIVKNLKVGHNLQDHVITGNVVFEVDKPVAFNSSAVMTPDAVLQYLTKGLGLLTSPATGEGIAFVNTKHADPSGTYPDIQINLVTSSFYNTNNTAEMLHDMYNIRPHLFDGTEYNNLTNKYLFMLTPILIHPKSTGRVMLRSRDPFEHPIIIPNYLAKKEDMDVMLEGIRLIFELIKTPPFQAFNTTPLKIPFPGCEEHRLFSNKYFECLARHFTVSAYHPVGTCPMGVGPRAVVDPRLRVYGVDGLRVIDGSVMPNITGGNPNAPIIMIGEKGSDMIKEDWGVHVQPPSTYVKKENCNKIIEC